MESSYDIKAWAGETTLGRRVFNYNFRMLGREVRGWQMLKAVPMHHDRTLSEMTYLWQNNDAPDRELVRVNIGELPDWRAAQKHLLVMLEHSMRPDLPRGTGRLAALGDVRFVARAPESDIPAAIQFARGNLAVSVNSVGSITIDVSEIAAIVDLLLSETPTKMPPLRTLAKTRPPKTLLARDKKGIPLVKDLKKVEDEWLKLMVPDGELRRKGDTLIYITPQPGKKTVRIYSIKLRPAPAARRPRRPSRKR